MEIKDRFAGLWKGWDARIATGESPQSILATASDEEILYLLGAEGVGDRKYTRDILVTAMLNRLSRRRRDLPRSAASVSRSARKAFDADQAGQDPIHAAEDLLKAAGHRELGEEVSASAIESLSATRDALHHARAHVRDLARTLAQARRGAGLAEAAAISAREADKVLEGLERKMAEFGRSEEGRAAVDATRAITRAAEAASRDAAARRDDLIAADDEARRTSRSR